MNVQEILNISKQRKARTKDVIKKIVENIHKKIRYYATLKKESCTYIVPPIIDSIPVYELELVLNDVFKILDGEGYIVAIYGNGQIDICWNEKLVEQKVKTDAYVLSEEERKYKNITKKKKKVDERFAFLANPKKVAKEPKTIEEQVDSHVKKILKEKERTQDKFRSIVGNFNKI